jgi:fucose 4-O-acetylase-like acetyltransferase
MMMVKNIIEISDCKGERTKMASRIDWIDRAKGYGIVLILLGHIPTPYITEYAYIFHVPLFFFISGYLFNNKSPFKTFLLKKVKGLLIPYFFLGIPCLIVDGLIGENVGAFANASTFSKYLCHFFIQRRMFSLWFLTALFVVELIYYGLSKIRKNEWKIINQ